MRPVLPVIDFQDLDQYGAAIEFLARQGIAFHTRPPQQIVVRTADYQALQEAKIISSLANDSRGKKTGSSAKSKAGRPS